MVSFLPEVVLKAQSGEQILVECQCDERGTRACNPVFEERRAHATAQYIRALDIASSQVKIRVTRKNVHFAWNTVNMLAVESTASLQ